jgi:HYDIN/CFA65/VesB family protein
MRKFSLIPTSLIIMIFMLWLIVPAQAYADTLEVLPTDHDFGDVEVGATVTTIISMTNINGSDVEVYGLGFQAGSSADFSMVDAPPVPIIVIPGETVEAEVAFTPSAVGYVTAVLEVESTDSLTPVHEVFLGGVGVAVQPPSWDIQDILAFFDASVEAGTLDGRGDRDRIKRARLRAFRFLLVATGTLIERGYYGWACNVLERAYIRSDGIPRPKDFVEGVARAELNAMIGQLMADMGC